MIDLLECVLDKGIVIDSPARGSIAGIELLSAEARVVVSSIVVYLAYAPGIAGPTLHSRAIWVGRRAIGTINST